MTCAASTVTARAVPLPIVLSTAGQLTAAPPSRVVLSAPASVPAPPVFVPRPPLADPLEPPVEPEAPEVPWPLPLPLLPELGPPLPDGGRLPELGD
jgi:hypothetical protein